MTLGMILFPVSTKLSTISETTNAGTEWHTGVNVVSVRMHEQGPGFQCRVLCILSTLIPHNIIK